MHAHRSRESDAELLLIKRKGKDAVFLKKLSHIHVKKKQQRHEERESERERERKREGESQSRDKGHIPVLFEQS